MSPERRAVHEHRRVLFEGGGYPVVHDYTAHGKVAGSDALGEARHVRYHVEALDTEPLAEAPEGADHSVRSEQDAVLVADLAHPPPVVRRRHQTASGILDRFQDHGGDELGALGLDHLLYGVGRTLGVLLRVFDVEK